MEKALRGHLYTRVVRCRQLLESDLAQQLEGTFGVHGDGALESPAGLGHLDAVGRAERQAIEAAIQHEERSGAGCQEAVQRYVRESAFTWLNRLAALKLMEHPHRGLILPTIGSGDHSRGFQQFSRLSPEAMRAEPDGGYRLYLELLCDDLGQALGVLFDRTLPTSILSPTLPCLQQVLTQLNDDEITPVWAEDETIGWIYQFFTPTELREEARKASSAPRNSHELAFRNQFYTPRYVVAFLVDNTLGRLWWEIRGGQTKLGEQCGYLVRRDGEGPVEKRDPRTFRILDPACGSGHFLLYCFDLLQTIYTEAYGDPDLGPALQADYPDPAAFGQAVPGMILEHNLHGIDIDLRAVQIAQLALWLRAQRAYAEMGLKVHQRPPIRCIQIVCAEPMPGEYDLLGEFVRDLRPAVLGNLVREVWEKMKLAGEAGSMLKIEQEIHEAVVKVRETLASLPPAVQLELFPSEKPQQLVLPLDRHDLDDRAFWDEAEERVVEALRAYVRQAQVEQHTARRLFAEDALQGIAFIDLLQRPFDVVLMNPPFGAASVGSKAYIER
ncbi:MAG: SAM-dependent methyltransferase, partial [Anaerolineae bacterium]|nr:SAM-dependent methyltransferase [Anaerolineae bacterium]